MHDFIYKNTTLKDFFCRAKHKIFTHKYTVALVFIRHMYCCNTIELCTSFDKDP
jgi:hypothetical protein